MGFYRSVSGMIRVKITTADIPGCLQTVEREQIPAASIYAGNEVTLELTIHRKDLIKLRDLCRKKGYQIETVTRKGVYWLLPVLLKRPVLIIGMVILIALGTVVPSRILTIDTEGNEAVPRRCILEQAEQCGLKFWTDRRSVRSEQIKNALLETIPQLQWAGVNTYGCKAVITVRERSSSEADDDLPPVCHIAAAQDGVIYSCTVTGGSQNCTVGQAVQTGDILISGYTDCGLAIIAERAQGQILAQTRRFLHSITPKNCRMQSESGRQEVRLGLHIGKKRINFYKGSGISGGSCDKMYSKYVLTLPGGFALPVALLKETTVYTNLTEAVIENPEQWLENFAEVYLSGMMTDGAIIRKSETLKHQDGIVQLDGVYDCIENIGTVQDEKIGEFNGKTDGTDRKRRPGG